MINRLRSWSLRATFIGIMAGSAMVVMLTVVVLIWSVKIANDNLERAATAQLRLEQFLQLSGRIADYGIKALETVRQEAGDESRLAPNIREVERVFDLIDQRISSQVNAVTSDDKQAAYATKGLNVARMRALFHSLHRQVIRMLATPSQDDREGAFRAQNMMNVFGVQFAPLLAQAIEDERKEIAEARAAMAKLRSRIVVIGAGLIVLTIVTACLLYYFAMRPVLRRISETMHGTEDLAAGNLARRLQPSGRDELALLMMQFNRMADSLELREQDLLKAQAQLQATIAERTQDLRLSNERLEFIDTQRRQFFSDVSHELRTPLTVILGESDWALKHAQNLDRDMAEAWKTIKARGDSLRRRVDDLLRVARSESGELDLRFSRVDLNAVVREAVVEIKPLAEKFNIALEPSFAHDALWLKGDPDWLRQAISGILTNAIRYGDTGKSVTIEAVERNGMINLAITDQGPGIPPDERPHLFKRFYRGEKSDVQTKERGERGFGIGLSLIKWVVEEHGGEISIETNDGKAPTPHAPENMGSLVKIILPFEEAARP